MSESHSHRREYVIIFVWLVVLTILEVGVVYIPGVAKPLLISALCLMAVAKAVLVALFFMHLKTETNGLKWTVLIPLALPVFYALILIGDASWRLIF
jgi:cytochrome c oxidase subunit 4